ncbi:MAG: hypothetical protein JRM86_03130 [Nitrososphaerota archaeon]|nr:hypothetical protein [Nitrososphaerota archaeon]
MELETTDASVRRKRHKVATLNRMLELRGRRNLRECDASDEHALRVLLSTMEAINYWDLEDRVGVPAPELDARLVLAA